jgi:hypothetical protein
MNDIDEVAEWIDAFVREGACYGATPTLRECMDVGDGHAGMRVPDDAGVEHRAGSPVYENAFLAALRALVAAGDIVPACTSEEQRGAWERWMAGVPEDAGTRAAVSRVPLRAVPRSAPAPEQPPRHKARAYLLDLLQAEGRVRYCRFYDGTEETERLLCERFGLRDGDESAAVLMDDVVWGLTQAGLVRTTQLPEKLSDGENDYLIERVEG